VSVATGITVRDLSTATSLRVVFLNARLIILRLNVPLLLVFLRLKRVGFLLLLKRGILETNPIGIHSLLVPDQHPKLKERSEIRFAHLRLITKIPWRLDPVERVS